MTKKYQKINSLKLPEYDHESRHEVNGRVLKGVAECPVCWNVYYKKKWFNSLELVNKNLEKKVITTREKICPACKIIQGKLFGGELKIEGFPKKYMKELKNLILNSAKIASEINPQDRIIKIEEKENGYRVLTVENSLVDRLAKKIKSVFKNTKITFSYSKEPYKVDRTHIIYETK